MEDLVRYSILTTFLKQLEKSELWRDHYFGMTIVQKLMYFFTQAGGANIPDYAFKFHHYGPYCDQLDTDLRVLKAAGAIKIETEGEGQGFKIETADVDWLPASLSEEFWTSHSDALIETLGLFGFQKPQDFELLATIHFVFHALCKESEGNTEQVVSLVKSLKPKFDEKRIKEEYDFLADKNLLTCT
jgi:hypothetical protein